jgi:hypothetical protein
LTWWVGGKRQKIQKTTVIYRGFLRDSTRWCWPRAFAASAPAGFNRRQPASTRCRCAQPNGQAALFNLPANRMKYARNCGKFFELDAPKRYKQEIASMAEAAKNDPKLPAPNSTVRSGINSALNQAATR